MRKLVSVQRVLSLDPIDGADRIETATILGWQTIVKKGEVQVGDLVAYFEVDCYLPDAPWSSFLKSKRLKTIKLRGQLSQGLALPLPVVLQPDLYDPQALLEDDDITELLGVIKYEPHVPGDPQNGTRFKRESDFPSYVFKTDEDRVQSAPRLLHKLNGRPYVITLKMDGSSFTATTDRDDVSQVHICSRNFVAKLDPERVDNFNKVALKYDIAGILRGTTYAIQGELCGPAIQNNLMKLPDHDLYVFNVFNWDTQRYLTDTEMREFCYAKGLKPVPLVEIGLEFAYSQADLLALAKGKYEGTENNREGLVIRSNDDDHPRVSFKAINNDYLLKEET